MSKLVVNLFAGLRQAGKERLELLVGPDATVADALTQLFAELPALREQVLTPDGTTLLPHVNVMLQGRLIRDLQGLATPLGEADTLAIFPPVAGG